MRTTINISVVLLVLAAWATAMPSYNPNKSDPIRARGRSLSLPPPPYFPLAWTHASLYLLLSVAHDAQARDLARDS